MTFRQLSTISESAQRLLSLLSDDTDRAEASSYFVSYLVVRAYAEFEQRINLLISRRIAMCTDEAVRSFAWHHAKCGSPTNQPEAERRMGRIKITDLSEVLAHFQEDGKEKFRGKLKPEAESAWESIRSTRISIAHLGSTANMTLAEFENYLKLCCQVVELFGVCLGLQPDQYKDLQ